MKSTAAFCSTRPTPVAGVISKRVLHLLIKSRLGLDTKFHAHSFSNQSLAIDDARTEALLKRY
jgi:hypothetical protein